MTLTYRWVLCALAVLVLTCGAGVQADQVVAGFSSVTSAESAIASFVEVLPSEQDHLDEGQLMDTAQKATMDLSLDELQALDNSLAEVADINDEEKKAHRFAAVFDQLFTFVCIVLWVDVFFDLCVWCCA